MIYYHFNIPTVGPFRCADTHMVYRPKRYKLFCPIVSSHLDCLNRIPETKYLGYILSEDQSDDKRYCKTNAYSLHTV